MKDGYVCHERHSAALSAKSIATIGVLTAMTAIATMFTRIPTPLPQGYFNLGDTVVLTAAILLGKWQGAFVGAFGSMMADVLLGGYIFAPITFAVKGIEGLIAGMAGEGAPPRGKWGGPKRTGGAGEAGNSGNAAGKDGAERHGGGGRSHARRRLAAQLAGRGTLFVCLGAAFMAFGYFVAEATVLRLFDGDAFGWTAAVTELPVNLLQGGISAILAHIIAATLRKARFMH
jgi:uncharacterized membrane protein